MAKSRKKPAAAVGFVLPRDAVGTGDPQTLGGLPGIWTPGKVHLAEEFEMTDDQVRGFIEDGYPVHEVEVSAEDESELKKALASARVDSIETSEEGEPEVEGTPTAEEHVAPADDEKEGDG